MTNQKSSQLRKVFKTAWQILKAGCATTFSIALKKAWVICKISFGNPIEITFAKKDTAELRQANAIQVGSLETIKDGYIRFVELASNGSALWKSFRIENLAV